MLTKLNMIIMKVLYQHIKMVEYVIFSINKFFKLNFYIYA